MLLTVIIYFLLDFSLNVTISNSYYGVKPPHIGGGAINSKKWICRRDLR